MPLEIIIDQTSRQEWQRLLNLAPRSAMQQDWAYGETVRAQGHQVRRVVFQEPGRKPVALLQMVERKLLGPVRIAMLMRGPVLMDQSRADELEGALLSMVRDTLGRTVLLWTPEREQAADRLFGFRRVMTGYSTIWLDLTRSLERLRADLDGKWRNMLVRAEDSRLTIKVCQDGALVDWLIEANERYRQKIGYRGPTPPFVRRLADHSRPTRSQTSLIAMEGSEPVAGVILQQHGSSATYFLGCTSERGRELRAHHLLLWRAIGLLKERGVKALDLGGVNTVSAGGLARFKLGLGGQVVTLAGTYMAAPSSEIG